MEKLRHILRLAAIALFGVLNISFGLCAGQTPLLLAGAAGMSYVALASMTGYGHAAQIPVA